MGSSQTNEDAYGTTDVRSNQSYRQVSACSARLISIGGENVRFIKKKSQGCSSRNAQSATEKKHYQVIGVLVLTSAPVLEPTGS